MYEVKNKVTGLTDKVLERITEVDMSDLRMPMIAVYNAPEDYPDKFVARIFDADKPTNTIMMGECLKRLKEELDKTGMEWLRRGAEDVPSLIGIYM